VLDKRQFISALRLIALAQQSGGRLVPEVARAVMSGGGPALPAAAMHGLNAVQTNFPPAAPADLQRYAAAFVQLDTDRDGLVKGADCIDLFMRWGLPQSVLRDAWALVAGGAGHLSQEQFVRCLYVLQSAKGGMPLPAALPPGPFPPVAGAAGGLASPDVQQFERLFAFGRYKEAAECAARAPGRLLRTCEVMARLRAAPSPAGQHPPLLIMFMCVMQSGRLDAQESAELARRAALAVTALSRRPPFIPFHLRIVPSKTS
jgi:hypothetical protein